MHQHNWIRIMQCEKCSICSQIRQAVTDWIECSLCGGKHSPGKNHMGNCTLILGKVT